MAAITDLIDPVELSEFARLHRDDFDNASQSLARFLPYREVGDIQYAYNKGFDALVEAAEFQAYDSESSIGRRPAGARVTGELPKVARKIPLSEYDALRLRNDDQGLVDGVFNDSGRMSKAVVARIELARGQLFQTGKVTIDEHGVQGEYDSGRDGGNTLSSITTDWDQAATADPIADVIAWQDIVKGLTEIVPDTLLVSRSVMIDLQKAEKVRGAIIPATMATGYTTREVVKDAFMSVAGVNVVVRENIPGMTATPINDDWVVLLPGNIPTGGTLWGITREAMEPEYSGLSPQPGVVAGAWQTRDPINVWTQAAGIALPIFEVPNATFSAKVK